MSLINMTSKKETNKAILTDFKEMEIYELKRIFLITIFSE